MKQKLAAQQPNVHVVPKWYACNRRDECEVTNCSRHELHVEKAGCTDPVVQYCEFKKSGNLDKKVQCVIRTAIHEAKRILNG